MTNKRYLRPIRLVFAAGLFSLALLAVPAHSQAASSQSFQILNGQARNGMIMSLTHNPGVVEPADTGNVSSTIGVVAPNTTDLSAQPGQINVQTDGEANALVSDLNGNILVGDWITASVLQGVGAKETGSGWVVGIAQASLNSKSKNSSQATVTDSKGKQHTVNVALIPILVKVTYYSTAPPSEAASKSTVVPAGLQQLANTLGGKHVSSLALIISSIVLTVGVVMAGVIIFSTVRSGFSALSRQPLSRRSILREEWRSFSLAGLILVIIIGASILILKFL